MAKIKEENEVKAVDLTSDEELKASIDAMEDVYYPVPNIKRSLGSNIVTGVGIAAAGGLAAYGLYHLVKKGVAFIKNLKNSKNKETVMANEAPKYEYEKVEENSGKPKAKANKKNRIGFKYEK